uniref:Uncharacterized protein n=1 Tax=Cacopsylla melanoneura TaxID=428564 RepID=A0A8D8YWW3_9HEMI
MESKAIERQHGEENPLITQQMQCRDVNADNRLGTCGQSGNNWPKYRHSSNIDSHIGDTNNEVEPARGHPGNTNSHGPISEKNKKVEHTPRHNTNTFEIDRTSQIMDTLLGDENIDVFQANNEIYINNIPLYHYIKFNREQLEHHGPLCDIREESPGSELNNVDKKANSVHVKSEGKKIHSSLMDEINATNFQIVNKGSINVGNNDANMKQSHKQVNVTNIESAVDRNVPNKNVNASTPNSGDDCTNLIGGIGTTDTKEDTVKSKKSTDQDKSFAFESNNLGVNTNLEQMAGLENNNLSHNKQNYKELNRLSICSDISDADTLSITSTASSFPYDSLHFNQAGVKVRKGRYHKKKAPQPPIPAQDPKEKEIFI